MQSIISLIQPLYTALGAGEVNVGDVWGLALCLLMLLGAVALTVDGKSEITKVEETTKAVSETEPKVVESEVAGHKIKEVVVPRVSWKDRLTKGLSRSRQEVWGKLEKIFIIV